ncbi:MAG TPA: hypothetical protein DD473_03490 [Planctomycetaceae bacterium]|nr:hypothetical protein [Planctomycetaceae bacterium]
MTFPVEFRSETDSETPNSEELLQNSNRPLVSIIVPTFMEAANLPVLIPQVFEALNECGMTTEILFVDDNSPDETAQVCVELAEKYPVQLLVRKTERGLSSAVLHGLNHAQGSVLLVMDADLSHPPQKVPELVAAALEQQGDFVIGSRYVVGGSTDDDWSFFRWLNSQVATWMSRGLTTAKDPMAGFFALTRHTYEQARELNPIGYKIGLELIVKCGCQKVAEVPIHFKDRLHGESKLSLKEQLNYLRHLARLYRFKMGQWFTPLLFGLVGASGAIVDLVLLTLLLTVASFPVARAVAICGAMSWNFLGNRFITFSDRKQESLGFQYLKFCGSCTLGAIISWGLSTFMWTQFSEVLHTPQIAAAIGILGGVVMNFLLSNYLVFPQREPEFKLITGHLQAESAQAHSEQFTVTEQSEEFQQTANCSTDHLPQKNGSHWIGWLGLLSALLITFWVTFPNWSKQTIDGLDQAHNVTTSLFFYDLYRDMPVNNPVEYTYDYQRQYPALGLIFWPPLFHAISGLAMLVTGPQLSTVYAVVTAFAFVLSLCLYAGGRSLLSVPLALMVVLLTVTAPEMVALQNSVMLEIPSIVFCLFVLWLYGNVTRRAGWKHNGEAILAGLACAAIAYTKQPAVFVLLGLFLDVLINHRHLLKHWKTWVCVGTAGVTVSPLALFTWKFGKVNIAQSFGNQGDIYVEHHQVASRWTMDAWTYYLKLLPGQLSWIVLVLSVVGLALLAFHPEFRKKQGVWLWSAVAWYLLFSYFDNKQVRFVAYVIPLLCLACGVALQWMWRQKPALSFLGAIACLTLVVPNLNAVPHSRPVGYANMEEYLQEVMGSQATGNVAYFGEDHHLFTAFLRLQDTKREHALLRGDDLLTLSEDSLVETLSKYQVRWVLIDPELPIGQQLLNHLEFEIKQFVPVTDITLFDNNEKSFTLRAYHFQGELAQNASLIPLKSSLLGLSE